MSKRVSRGAAGKQPRVSGVDVRRAGYARVTAARLDPGNASPRRGPAWSGAARTWPAARAARRPDGRTCPAGQAWCWYTHLTSPASPLAAPTGPLWPGSGPVLRGLPLSPGPRFREGWDGMGRFVVPDGWTVQAFRFALDCTPEQEACLRRQFGGRRYARNWAVRTLKEDITRYREAGQETEAPSLAGLRKRWNQAKDTECTDAETGEAWWPHISKEAFADGIKGAVDAYWNWHSSRAGTRQGRRAGFPRFAKKGRDRDRVTFTTGAIRVEPDRRHVTLPRVGTVRVPENTRRLQRLISKGRARILAATVSRTGTRLEVAFRVLVQRPVQPRVAMPGSRAGVDVGVRVLATVASSEGEVLERVPNPRPLEAALKQLRHLSRERCRRTRGSSRYRQTQRKITRLHRRAADIRAHHIHALTTRLAKTHGEITVEGLDAAAMLAQKGLSGARARRRGLSDSALSETRRQLA
jgi:putative transposase